MHRKLYVEIFFYNLWDKLICWKNANFYVKSVFDKINLIFYERLKYIFLRHWIFARFLISRFSYFVVIQKLITVAT